MEKIKKIEWKPNKKNIGEDWNIRVEHFLNESIFDPKNFFWQYKDNLNKKITKIKKNKWNKNSVFQSVDEKYYPPKSIFIEKTIENETVWLLPVERYKMGLSFYNKNYEINCIERLFNIKERQLLNKVTQFEDKLKIKSTLNQLKLNKNK